ncbi:DUF1553 domain-containing protein [Flavobacteriaceae bacterium TP-CH-4]|uniref:DUF1553 domain-containing protein n=1 Tax=Pelagihabitans pacificus TaxID=2696054 RepID=A0A967AWN9_9FLAO|nr:DUF1553 domain-containing protein [Pelagihabitans pacificus]NHF58962.1 DUF1553 domain-containing protein [Pelagihabitans pacificus]
MISGNLFFGIGLLSLLATGCGVDKPEEVLLAENELPETVDFNFHIKPILSDRCFACHGPDQQNQKARLRLDIADSAFAALQSGNGFAIKPGNLDKSEVYHRVVSTDPDVLMPPPESNLQLSPLEIAYIAKWIEQGAEYKTHWAFSKPVKRPVPEAGENWAKNEIDRFIASKLEEKGIAPSPESRKEVLIRRLYFDLIGLPPSVAEVERLMAKDDPQYYEALVDSLLNLPAYGERMAAHWLDVARFADSEGYLDDFHHEFWPYRDWVIDAFNKNLPYDDFILWQVGGDQLPDAGEEQRLATAFNRLHKQNSEGGVIPEEFRVEYVADRTNTVGTAFLGLTVACARCHDHKYDPISQEDYFELFGFFNSTIERGDGIFAFNAVENGNDVPNELSMNAGPVMPVPSKDVAKIYEFLQREIDQKASDLKKTARTNEPKVLDWLASKPSSKTLEKVVTNATVVDLDFERSTDGISRDRAKGSKDARYFGHAFVPGKKGTALQYQEGKLIADGSRVSFERMEPFTVSFWIKTPKEYDEARVIYNGNGRIQGYRGWEVVLDSTRLSFRLNHAHPYQSLEVRMPEAIPLNQWQHFVWSYDGSSKAAGMAIYQNGKPIQGDILRDLLYRSAKPYTDKRATVYMHYEGLVLGSSHYDQHFDGGFIDDFKVLNREAGQLVANYLYDEQLGSRLFQESITSRSAAINEFHSLHLDTDLASERKQLQELQQRELQTIDTVQEIMVMGDLDKKRPTYILDRGVYDAHGKQVGRDVPETILPWPEDLPRNRYGLGKWLIHPDNPLTARVAVNQLWYLMFGRGLVKTNGDFGNQGALPSHPELLDWLAVDFMENGWDVKRLIRQMVTSATYRQSSAIRKDLNEIDPDNILLARSPRYRRSAEMVRDNVLAVSGLLNTNVGGKSVFPYQPEGLWSETISHPFFPDYEIDYENGLYRRSLYTFWKRNVPVPSMLVFDASSRSECQVQRQRSNTPLQALVLLNGRQVIEACRVLAENTWTATDFQLSAAIDRLFLALIGRSPTERERDILMRQYQAEKEYFAQEPLKAQQYLSVGVQEVAAELPSTEVAALTRVANTLLNSTEAYYKN